MNRSSFIDRIQWRRLQLQVYRFSDSGEYGFGQLIDVDIPQLTSDDIDFGDDCFQYTYTLQSSSTHTPISSSFDAAALESAIRRKSWYL